METIFSEIIFKNTPVLVKNKNKTKYSLIKQIYRFLLSCILEVFQNTNTCYHPTFTPFGLVFYMTNVNVEVRVTTWESGGGVPSCRRPTGIRKRSSRRCGNFTAFFFKFALLGIFWPKFLLKSSYFECLNKRC